MPREKAQSVTTARPKVPMRRLGAHCLVVAMKRGNARGAKGVGHQRWIGSTGAGSTGTGRNLIINGRRQPSHGGTSHITSGSVRDSGCNSPGLLGRRGSAYTGHARLAGRAGSLEGPIRSTSSVANGLACRRFATDRRPAMSSAIPMKQPDPTWSGGSRPILTTVDRRWHSPAAPQRVDV